jgi:hypothetical protein
MKRNDLSTRGRTRPLFFLPATPVPAHFDARLVPKLSSSAEVFPTRLQACYPISKTDLPIYRVTDMNETTSTLANFRQPSHDEISTKAREIWESYGRPAGRDEEIWLEAERQLQPQSAQNAPAAATETAPASPPSSGSTARAMPRSSGNATPRAARRR